MLRNLVLGALVVLIAAPMNADGFFKRRKMRTNCPGGVCTQGGYNSKGGYTGRVPESYFQQYESQLGLPSQQQIYSTPQQPQIVRRAVTSQATTKAADKPAKQAKAPAQQTSSVEQAASSVAEIRALLAAAEENLAAAIEENQRNAERAQLELQQQIQKAELDFRHELEKLKKRQSEMAGALKPAAPPVEPETPRAELEIGI